MLFRYILLILSLLATACAVGLVLLTACEQDPVPEPEGSTGLPTDEAPPKGDASTSTGLPTDEAPPKG